MRPIDGDALVKKFENMGLGENGLIERIFADGVFAVIENAPTIEAEPVRHGRWEQDYELVQGPEDNSEYPYVACNLCGNKEYGLDLNDYTDYDDLPNYCPNCGARMDVKYDKTTV